VFRHRFLFCDRFVEHEAVEAAAVANMEPFAQVFFPGNGHDARRSSTPPIEVQPSHVHVVAIKRSEVGDKLVVRLQNLASSTAIARLRVADLPEAIDVPILPFRLSTILVSRAGNKMFAEEATLVEGL
jgi:alpha-mannosidase